MKHYINKILLMLCLFATTSCSDFLDREPDFVSPYYYYETEEELTQAMNGVYNRLIDTNGRMYSKGLFSYFALSDESFYKNISTGNIRVMTMDAADLDIGRFWEVLYEGVNRANYLLKHMDENNLDTDTKKAIYGEALFMRGYYYFLLTTYFGEVPLRLEPTETPNVTYVGKSPLQDIYAQIVKDMQEAEDLVLDIDVLGSNERISKTGVQAILARVFLKMAGEPLNDKTCYDKALEYTNKVIDSGKHELNENYSRIFINQSQDINEIKECIWEVGMYGNKIGSIDLAGSVGVENGILCRNQELGYSGGAIQITQKLYSSFDANDLRRDWCISPYYFKDDDQTKKTSKVNYTASQIYNRNPGKWRREYETGKKAQYYNSTNFPIIRYSDVLLMKAEAENEVNNGPTDAAYEAINQVRRRAFGTPVGTANAVCDLPAGLQKTDFFYEIQNERFREFCFEGMRRFDLIRWGIYIQTMNAHGRDMAANAGGFKYGGNAGLNATSRNVLFPIPNTELTMNKFMTQNKDW